MIDLLYITPTSYHKAHKKGGMGTKTKAIREAWGKFFNITVADRVDFDLHKDVDVIMIELLGLRNRKGLPDRITEFKALKDTKKVVFGSDSEIFRWSGNDLDALTEVVDLWIPNTQWQQAYFRDFDLPVTDVVAEPTDTNLFRPGEKEKIILAGGAINYGKNIPFHIELYGTLQGMDTGDYQTAFLGSADMWGKVTPQDLKLQAELKKVTDIFHGYKEPDEVAPILSSAGITLFSTKYDTCCRFSQEDMASGGTQIANEHRLWDERPNAGRFSTVEECIELMQLLTEDWTSLPDPEFGKTARTYAEKNFSYEVTLEQMFDIFMS